MKWTKKEVEHAARIMLEAEKRKSMQMRFLDEIIHWVILLVIVLGNTVLDFFLVVGAGVLGIWFYGFVGLVALAFGMLSEVVTRDLATLDSHKHLLLKILLPLVALVNIYLLWGVSVTVTDILGIAISFNVILAGVVYGVVFLVPHALQHFRRKK